MVYIIDVIGILYNYNLKLSFYFKLQIDFFFNLKFKLKVRMVNYVPIGKRNGFVNFRNNLLISKFTNENISLGNKNS